MRFKTALFGAQNDSFWRAKRAILRCKTGHFEKQEDFYVDFVRFFYLNNGFRLRRMKKILQKFFVIFIDKRDLLFLTGGTATAENRQNGQSESIRHERQSKPK